MEIWLWAFAGIMTALSTALLVKIYILQKAAKEIETAFTDRLITDTNVLIDISSSDKYMRNLANTINIELKELRKQKLQFYRGDEELKNAITNISHDLRTPLTAICGYLDMIEQEKITAEGKRYIEILKNRTDMLTELTNELFQYSVVVSNENNLNQTPIIINNVLEESIAAFYTAFKERKITPVIRITEKKIIRMLDSAALARVFSNLLNNAVKYSDGDLYITLIETGKIIFTNTASGLNEVKIGKLFDRFYTINNAGNSTGLGLAIAKTLTEKMNGTISAKYENNKLSVIIDFK